MLIIIILQLTTSSPGEVDGVHSEESEVVEGSVDKKYKKLEISIWSLEYALCKVMKAGHVTQSVSLSRIGKPRSLTRDEVANLATDKHEKALVNNIILPQDIGVSYAMIGGLGLVKELLQQCVTYPLKYPGLYREGIAAEAVKGVLLFGPPGMYWHAVFVHRLPMYTLRNMMK